MIRAAGISKKHGSVTAIDDITLEIGGGEVVALVGRSSSGRTTLLNILATVSRPDSGSLEIDGIDAIRHPLRARRRIGFLGATEVLYDELTVKEHLSLWAACRGSRRAEDAAASALALFELEGERRVSDLAAGLRRRLALTSALMGDPRVLLLDGPSSSLDSRTRERLMDSLEKRARGGAAIVLVADDPDVWRPVCHKIALLEEGKLRRVVEVSRISGGAQELVAEVFPMGDD